MEWQLETWDLKGEMLLGQEILKYICSAIPIFILIFWIWAASLRLIEVVLLF